METMEFSEYPAFKKFNGMTILSIDYGTKVIGLATFTPGKDPYPVAYGTIIFKSEKQVIEDIKKIIESENIEVLVFGIPRFTDGKESKMTQKMKAFYKKLSSTIKIQTYEQDETLTTFEAKERMLNSPRYNFKIDMKKIDEVSATIILEDFIKNS
ncbi:MAG: Holliday junction resolvase RuvX [Bacteriovoracaceae bacterium]|nr:Holliday junction resolvase RuvX [Bacteriovoracaceae bacterium]